MDGSSLFTQFLQNVFSGLETGSVYALAALGLALIFQTSKLVNFAQGTFGMFNAFICTSFFMKLPWPADMPQIAKIIISLVIAMICAAVIGILVDMVVLSRSKISHMSKQLITLSMVILFEGIAPMIFGKILGTKEDVPFPSLVPPSVVKIGGAAVQVNSIVTVVLVLVVMGLMFYILQFTKWGLAARVTASNPTTAKLMGVPVAIVNHAAWAIASMSGCLAAIVFAYKLNIKVTMMADIHLSSFIAAVLGGFETFYGPVVGALIIGVARNIIAMVGPLTEWSVVILYALILIFIVIKPNGLFGKKTYKKV